MSQTFVVHLLGDTHANDDGVERQPVIAQCRHGEVLTLRADPANRHDRHAVAVLNSRGQQLGFLPSDARDASAVLRGEGITATVERLIGGTRWWHRLLGVKRSYGLLMRLDKASIDWKAHNEHRALAESADALVTDAIAFEKLAPTPDLAITRYEAALAAVIELNASHPVAAAHRFQSAPINRLTMLLVRQKRQADARAHYSSWTAVRDPIGLPKAERESVEKRIAKLEAAKTP